MKALKAVAAIAVIAALAITGTADYEDAKAAAELYTQYVCEGTHPDYDNRKPDCSDYGRDNN